MSFKEIICQDRAIEILHRSFVSGKWAHAYIFSGTEGIGKFKTAREWARLLLCCEPRIENGFADSCGLCKSCVLFETEAHPDFVHIYKELLEFTKDNAGKKTPVDLSIDVVREFLVAKAPTRPTLSQRKVFVINEAERLNNSSQNCLLKVLEEPPEYCCIILLCTRLEKLLPTTKSRCQIIRFGPIEENRIIDKLEEMGLEKSPAQFFARLAQGSIGQAYQWGQLELADGDLYKVKKRLIESVVGYKLVDALILAQQILSESKKIATEWISIDKATSKTDINRRAMKFILRIIISAIQDVMHFHIKGTKESVNFDQNEQIQKLTERFDVELAAEKISDCCRLLEWIESSVNEKLIFERLLLSLANSDTIKV